MLTQSQRSLLIDTLDQNLQVSDLIFCRVYLWPSELKLGYGWLCPLLTGNGPLAIDAGRHPILESIHNDFVVCNWFIFCWLFDLMCSLSDKEKHRQLFIALIFSSSCPSNLIHSSFCSPTIFFYQKHQTW